MKVYQPAERLDPRDGPTEERIRHGSGIASRDSGLGKRTVAPIERMLVNKEISAEQAHAGHRFALDYEIGAERMKSALADLIGGGRIIGRADVGESRGDAINRWFQAARALDSNKSPYAVGMAPSVLLRTFLTDPVMGSYMNLSRKLGHIKGQRGVRVEIVRLLGILSEHYEAVDKVRGRSETPHTKEAALKRIIPSDQV